MADLVFNIAKGRVAEFYRRVEENDPTTAALLVIAVDANGETDANFRDFDTLGALLASTANEVTNSGYARKSLDEADLAAFAPDDANDRVDLDIPDQTWTGVAAGDAWTDLIIAFDRDVSTDGDVAVVPCTLHDFAVTPDGSDITVQIAAAGFFRAS